MIFKVKMPRLSDTMVDGVIVHWHRGAGDHVVVGDHLVDIETDKAVVTYSSPCTGRILEAIAAGDSVIELGSIIATIETDG